jgi:hypothetical protein
VPSSLCRGDEWTQHVTEIHAKAGDCVVFMEACVHGALPWKAAHERRALLYRYIPGHAACAKTTYFCRLCADIGKLRLPPSDWICAETVGFAAADTPGLGTITYPDWIKEMDPGQAAVLLNPGFPSAMRLEHVIKPTVEQFLKDREAAKL